jgi:predicted negative regulator of RcsB-dependent stress response
MADPKSVKPVPASPDAPPEATFEWQHSPFERFLEKHFKKLLIGVGVVAVAVAAVLVHRQRSEEQRVREGQAFAAAVSVEDYRKVIANYPGTAAAGSAQFMLAQLAEKNSPAEAIGELERFLADYPDHPLRDHAAFRAAVLMIAKGDTEGGIGKLDSFLRNYSDSEVSPVARIRKGDALAALGRTDEARKVYEDLIADVSFAGSPFFQLAENRLAQVKLKPPVEVEFVPEPEPKPAPASGQPAPSATGGDLKIPSILDDLPGVGTPLLPELPKEPQGPIEPPPPPATPELEVPPIQPPSAEKPSAPPAPTLPPPVPQ